MPSVSQSCANEAVYSLSPASYFLLYQAQTKKKTGLPICSNGSVLYIISWGNGATKAKRRRIAAKQRDGGAWLHKLPRLFAGFLAPTPRDRGFRIRAPCSAAKLGSRVAVFANLAARQGGFSLMRHQKKVEGESSRLILHTVVMDRRPNVFS
jgi:hypothetical protein